MTHTTMLTDILQLHFAGWHLARIKCLAYLMVALFKVKTVNLTQLATASPALNFFRSLPVSTHCTLHNARLVCGHMLWVTGMRLPSGDYLIIVSDDQSDTVMEEYQRRWEIELVNWELKSGLGLGQHQVSGDEKRSENSIGVAVPAYLFLLRACHHEITPGQSWRIFQLQHALQLRAITNQVEHNVKVKMAKGRKAA